LPSVGGDHRLVGQAGVHGEVPMDITWTVMRHAARA
jgi:hypothetical protein